MKLTHFINLSGLGGIERLFSAFIDSTDRDIEHHILIKGRALPLHVARHLRFKGSLISYKRWGSLNLPGWPRRLRTFALQHRVTHACRSDALLVWSQLNSDDIAKVYQDQGARAIHYEHGSAWLSRPSKTRRAFLDRADAIICASNACARMLSLRWQVPAAKTTVVKNPLLPSLLPNDGQKKQYRPEGQPWRLGTAGRIVPVKGHHLAIATVALLAKRGIDCRLRIAGEGPLKEPLKALALNLGVTDKVEFLGFVEDMGAFYRSIDVFLCPSLSETFGLVSLEAAAWGCPVVATCVDGLPETLVDGESGCLVIPTRRPSKEATLIRGGLPIDVYNPVKDQISPPLEVDPDDLSMVLERLFADPKKLLRMSIYAAKMVSEKFSYSAYNTSMISLLSSLQGNPFKEP